ncbi:MAG: NYN domain-containing protein [Deltaproteobacteria bacterium]
MGAHLVVDGYNLARSGALFLSEDPAGEAGRAELCALLAGYARAKGFRLTVVFDGRGAGRPERSRAAFKGGTAVYASARETADDVIREVARDAPAGLVVVTSDRGLAGTLSARAVTVVSCPEFAERLEARRMAALKGTDDGGADGTDRGPRKKGEGHRMKKADRARDRALRKLL